VQSADGAGLPMQISQGPQELSQLATGVQR
jgi:hypothetical protein